MHLACTDQNCEFNRTDREFNWTGIFNRTGLLQDHRYNLVRVRSLCTVSGGRRLPAPSIIPARLEFCVVIIKSDNSGI